MGRSLRDLSGLTGVPLDEVALAIAAEFGSARVAETRARLDLLAAGAGNLADLAPEARAQRLLGMLGDQHGFDVSGERGPETLMLDHVVAGRRGHPLALAIVYVAVARRIGVLLQPVGTERFLLLGDTASRPPIALDPVPGGRRPPREMRWLCPHLVAAMLLDAITARQLERGDLGLAIRAAELRLVLPLAGPLRARHRAQLTALRARLN